MENDRRKSCLMSLLALLMSAGIFFVFGEILSRVLNLDTRDRLVMVNPEGILDFKGLHRISENPDRVYELVPGSELSLESGKRTATYSVNSLGFRDVEFDENKPEGVFRIMVLGDSMTFGPAVSLEKTYPKVLEELLNEEALDGTRFEVINAGVSGYNTYQELATWKEFLSLEPDLVIVGFCVNDIDDPRRHVDAHTLATLGDLPEEMIPNPNVAAVANEEVSSYTADADEFKGRLPIPFKTFLREHSAFYRFLVRRYDALLKTLGIRDPVHGSLRAEYDAIDAKLSDYDSPEWTWLKKQWDDLDELSSSTGTAWVMLITPWQYQLGKDYSPVVQERLTEYALDQGTPFVDPRPQFLEGRASSLYIDMAHFSETGHELVADALLEGLRDRGLVPVK